MSVLMLLPDAMLGMLAKVENAVDDPGSSADSEVCALVWETGISESGAIGENAVGTEVPAGGSALITIVLVVEVARVIGSPPVREAPRVELNTTSPPPLLSTVTAPVPVAVTALVPNEMNGAKVVVGVPFTSVVTIDVLGLVPVIPFAGGVPTVMLILPREGALTNVWIVVGNAAPPSMSMVPVLVLVFSMLIAPLVARFVLVPTWTIIELPISTAEPAPRMPMVPLLLVTSDSTCNDPAVPVDFIVHPVAAATGELISRLFCVEMDTVPEVDPVPAVTGALICRLFSAEMDTVPEDEVTGDSTKRLDAPADTVTAPVAVITASRLF